MKQNHANAARNCCFNAMVGTNRTGAYAKTQQMQKI
jgi:hypothetical protein